MSYSLPKISNKNSAVFKRLDTLSSSKVTYSHLFYKLGKKWSPYYKIKEAKKIYLDIIQSKKQHSFNHLYNYNQKDSIMNDTYNPQGVNDIFPQVKPQFENILLQKTSRLFPTLVNQSKGRNYNNTLQLPKSQSVVVLELNTDNIPNNMNHTSNFNKIIFISNSNEKNIQTQSMHKLAYKHLNVRPPHINKEYIKKELINYELQNFAEQYKIIPFR